MYIQEKDSQLLNNNSITAKSNIRIVYGKEMLNPVQFVPSVSETIKKYIEEQFATPKSKKKQVPTPTSQ